MTLRSTTIPTPLGPMIAIANDTALYLLEFTERRGLAREIEQLHAEIKPGLTPPIKQITAEIDAYFAKELRIFKTPCVINGTDFQKHVWQALCDIPYGETISYAEQAKRIDRPKAFRAVANANGRNQFAILIPCHRVITSSGHLGGYGGGVSRKQALIDLEVSTNPNL